MIRSFHEKISNIFEKYNLIILIAIVFAYVRTRLNYLGEICYYLHADELRDAFDAVSLAHSGTDGLLAAPSLYVWLSALIIKIKGGLFSLKLFRLLSVAGGAFGMIFMYLTVSEITKKKRYAFISSILVLTLPVFFISERTGMGEYLFLDIVPAAFYFLLKGSDTSNRLFCVISGLLWGLSMMTGGISWLVPLFLIPVLIYLFLIKKITLRDLAFVSVPFVIMALVSAVTGPKNTDMGFSYIPFNIMNIKALLWDNAHPYDITSAFGTIYVLSIPAAVIGAILSVQKAAASLKERAFDVHTVLWFFIIVSLLGGLMTKDSDIRTCNGIFFALTILICEGLVWICEEVRAAYYIEIAVYIICFVFFTRYYFENFNSEVNNSVDHEQGIVVDKSVGEAIKSSLKELPDKKISVITDDFEGRNLMIALYGNASPSEYMSFKDDESFSFGNIRVSSGEEPDMSGDTVYIVNQAEHQDVIDTLTSMGWGNIYLKEYTICFIQ